MGGLVLGLLFRMNMIGMKVHEYGWSIFGFIFFSVMSAWAHYHACVDDQGKVLPHHFRDEDQIYYQKGKKSMAFHEFEG